MDFWSQWKFRQDFMSLICKCRQKWLIIGTIKYKSVYSTTAELMTNKNSRSLDQSVWKLQGADTIMAEVAQQNNNLETSPGFSTSSAGFRLDFA